MAFIIQSKTFDTLDLIKTVCIDKIFKVTHLKFYFCRLFSAVSKGNLKTKFMEELCSRNAF